MLNAPHLLQTNSYTTLATQACFDNVDGETKCAFHNVMRGIIPLSIFIMELLCVTPVCIVPP